MRSWRLIWLISSAEKLTHDMFQSFVRSDLVLTLPRARSTAIRTCCPARVARSSGSNASGDGFDKVVADHGARVR